MSLTYNTARDEMFALFVAKFTAPANALVNGTVEQRFQGVLSDPTVPPADKYWVRLSTQNVTSEQTAFVANANGTDSKAHTNYGVLFVEIYAPFTEVNGFRMAGDLADIARKVFQNRETCSSVWFRNVRVNDLPNDEKAFRFNVVAEYEFDQHNQ